MEKKVAVIGAGIAGLTCAYELNKAGYKVTVFEKNNYVGGRMSTRIRDSFYFDIGADHLANLYDQMKEYCQELGIEWQKMEFLNYDIVKGGKLVPLNDAVGIIGKSRLTWEFLKTKNETDFFDLSTTIKYDNKENAYEYCKKKMGQEAADYLCDPFTSTYQFHRGKEISLGAFKGIMESLKRERPRWYLHRTKGGMSALPEAMAKTLDMRLGDGVESVVKEGDKIVVEIGPSEKIEFDLVVIASTGNVTKNILKTVTPEINDLLDNVKYAKSVSVAFKVSTDKLPRDKAIVWVPFVESQKISGIINELYKGEQLTHDNTSLLSTWLHEEFAESLIDLTNEQIVAQVKPELARVCPWVEEEDLVDFDLEKWKQAMPKFYKGWLQKVADFMPKNGQNNIYLCGDYLNSPWTEGALRCGQRVAQSIIEKENRNKEN